METSTIRACSIWRALEVVGDVATLLIMERAFLGCHRFEEFVAQTRQARSVISSRLARLVKVGIFTKEAVEGGRRQVYRLQPMGRELFPTALMMLRWQHRWEPARRGIRVRLVHRSHDHAMEPTPVCAACNVEIDPRAVSWQPGPGLSQVTPAYQRRRRQMAAASAKRDEIVMVDSAIELFGDRWATLVVRACFTGINRYDDIQRDTLMATNILSDRIDRLLAQGILKPVLYSAHQGRFEYRLTEKGRDIYPVLLALLKWGDAWFSDEKGPPLILTHKPCGQALDLSIKCSECHEALELANVGFEISSGSGSFERA
jgi:DNA-binding HxlR family transcriptional regulator